MRGADLLPFLDLARHGDAPALFDDQSEAWVSYHALDARVTELSKTFQSASSSPLEGEEAKSSAYASKSLDFAGEGEPSTAANSPSPRKTTDLLRKPEFFCPLPQGERNARALVLCVLPRSVDGVAAYLAAARAGCAIALGDTQSPNLPHIASAYEPEWIVAPLSFVFDGYNEMPWPLSSLRLLKRTETPAHALHPDFYLMLLTSGSTGSSKGVRLSYRNIASNTNAIAKSLSLSAQSNALGHLPISYSFGISVVHTQLSCGARCTLTDESMMSGAFWKLAREQNVTLFPGVPYHYEMMMRLGLARLKLPSLTTFLQAGGKMQLPLTQKMLEEVQKRDGGELFIMYGQTEAAPRISCFPLHLHPEKIGSSGKALDGGKLEIIEDEIVYTGPNVMMGHATGRADLAKGDEMNGCLATGDLGTLDADGYLTITGRKQRFAKLFGQRVALDDLEKMAAPIALCIAVEHPEKVVMVTLCDEEDKRAAIKEALVAHTKLPAPWIEVLTLAAIPTKTNGKIDYQMLQKSVVDGGA